MAKPQTTDTDVLENCGIAWLQNDKNRSLPSNVPGGIRPDRFYSRQELSRPVDRTEARKGGSIAAKAQYYQIAVMKQSGTQPAYQGAALCK
jgi:hypothetical protein